MNGRVGKRSREGIINTKYLYICRPGFYAYRYKNGMNVTELTNCFSTRVKARCHGGNASLVL